jgi:putative membrane protein
MTHAILRGACAAFALAITAPLAAHAQDPQEFLRKAIKGDNSEIMLGHMAENRGADPAVRHFGHTLVEDHTMARDQAMHVASRMGVSPPDGPAREAMMERDRLSGMHGRQFDREFVHYMIDDHQKDIGDFRDAAQMRGPASRMAREQLPTLRKHLEMARSIAQGGGDMDRDMDHDHGDHDRDDHSH